MALTVKIDPVAKITTANILAELSLPEQKKAAADFAREGLEEGKRVNQSALGKVPPYTTTVDGRAGAQLESVNLNPSGTIVFEFELVGQVLQWIGKTLQECSPVVSGAYKRGHKLFADGTETTIGGNIPPAAEYVFANSVPYARKIEVGKTEGGRAFVIQVANRIYERTAKDAKAQFGKSADIRFAYRDITGGKTPSPAIVVRLQKA